MYAQILQMVFISIEALYSSVDQFVAFLRKDKQIHILIPISNISYIETMLEVRKQKLIKLQRCNFTDTA